MSKIADLAKQGVFYRPLSDATAKPDQASKKDEQGDFSRGFDKAMLQVPQTLGGAAAYVGDVVGAEGLKEYGLGVYRKNSEKIDAISKDSDSLSNVMESDASGADWLQNTAGYVTGQALQTIVTGGLGGFIGSQLAKRGIANVVARGANSVAAKQVAGKVAAKGATVGAGTALFGSNLAQEAGSIYPEALDHAAGEGRELEGGDLARVGVAATGAAAVDTAMDAIMMGRVLKGARKPGESMLRAGAREVPGAMARETVTEGIQTGIERWGAQKELGTADAIREYVDSMGVGAVGGGMGGAASVIRANKAVPEVGPLSRAANVATEAEVLQLEHNPQPLISFPDGSVGSQQELHAYLSQYADPEERARKEHELMGRDPETGKPIEPEQAKSAESPEAEAQALADWGAQHDPIPLEQAHALLAAPGMKGENMMVAPHPGGEGFTLVPSEWLTLDSQARHGELQKPAPAAKAEAKPETAPEPQSAAQNIPEIIPAAETPAEPEWKTNPYTAYKFADRERADAFMVNKGADPALFEAREIESGKFAIKRRVVPLSPTEGLPDADDNAILPAPDGAARGPGDPVADPAEPGEAVGSGAVAAQPEQRGTADDGAGAIAESDPVRAAGSADADPALSDSDWKQFAPETGTLSIPRADMPQIKAEHRGAMVNFLNARGIEHAQEEIDAGQLKPTQAEFSLSKVDKAKRREGGERAILVSSDGHVLDGHHQWLAAVEKGEPVKAIRLGVPISQLLEAVREFPSATVSTESIPENSNAQPEASAAPEPQPRSEEAAPVAEAGQSAEPRDDGTDIPLAFYKKTRVTADVMDDETGVTAPEQVPSDQALAAVREDIKNLTALLKCMKGG